MRQVPAIIAAFSLALLFVASGSSASDDKINIRNAIATFEQRSPSIPELRRAAASGDKEAQFYLAETLRLLSGRITPEAYSWYKLSAGQGDMYSMYRLSTLPTDTCSLMENCPASSASSEAWGTTLLEVALEKAKKGDGEGLEMMYTLSGNLDWLLKSAAVGYPSAQHWLAVRYDWGDGWFLWPGERRREIERLYKAAAEGGYPRAMSEHAVILLLKGDLDGAQKWLMKGVSVSYIPAVGAYASVLEDGRNYHLEPDQQLAYALYLMLSEIGGGVSSGYEYSLNKLRPQLTRGQLAAAVKQAEVWKATHPPLSYYPPKLIFIR